MSYTRLLATCFGLGKLPIAPGTWGSLPPVAVLLIMGFTGIASPITVAIVMVVLALIGSIVCVRCAPASIAATGKKDPSEVVTDEFAGQAVTFIFAGIFAAEGIFVTALFGFLLFRFFDIIKPWPLRKLEKLPHGWGVLADDLGAGIYAGIFLFLSFQFGLISYLNQFLVIEVGSLNVPIAVILGAVQGLTEFLPVSSSGHLVLFESLLDFDPETPQMLLFDLAVHIGTLFAIVVVFGKSFAAFLRNLLASGKYLKSCERKSRSDVMLTIYKKSPSVRLLVLCICATFVTGIVGVLLKKYFVGARGSLGMVALMWLITGTLLLLTDRKKKARLGLRGFLLWHAIIIGLAQGVAIMPGISRSGATICAAILLGLHRRWALEFSFLLAIPAILGATFLTLMSDWEVISSNSLPVLPVVLGTMVAAFVGILSLKLLIKAARSFRLKLFAFYCYILAVCVGVYVLR